MSDVEKNAENEMVVWGAVGPNGHVVKSSIGIFKAVANRWALRRGNYEVVKLGTIKAPTMEEPSEKETGEKQEKQEMQQETSAPRKQRRARTVRGPTTRKRGPGRPRKSEVAAAQNQEEK